MTQVILISTLQGIDKKAFRANFELCSSIHAYWCMTSLHNETRLNAKVESICKDDNKT